MLEDSGVWHGVKCGRRLPSWSQQQLLSSDIRSKVWGPNILWARDHVSSERVQSRSECWCREASAGFPAEGTYWMSIKKLNSWLYCKIALITSFILELLPPLLCHDPNRAVLSMWASMREFWILWWFRCLRRVINASSMLLCAFSSCKAFNFFSRDWTRLTGWETRRNTGNENHICCAADQNWTRT